MKSLEDYIRKYSFIVRYGITGGIGGALQTFVLYIWVSVLGLTAYYLWGLVIGFCITLGVSFTLQKYWTFSYRAQHHMPRRQFVFYGLTALASLGLNALLLFLSKEVLESLGVDFFKIWYLVAQVVIIFVVALLSFLFNYFVTFKEKKDGHASV